MVPAAGGPQRDELPAGLDYFLLDELAQHLGVRLEIEVFDNFSTLLDLVKKSGYSRIPVSRNNLDRVEGVLYIKDLLPFLNEGATFQWQKLIRPAYFALETRKIDHLLKGGKGNTVSGIGGVG